LLINVTDQSSDQL